MPGNHDYRLVSPWLEWRSRNGPEPLGLEERAGPEGVHRRTRHRAAWSQPASARRRLPGHLAARRRLRHPRPLPRPPRHGPDASSASAPAFMAPLRRRCPADGATRPTTTRRRSRRCTRWMHALAQRVGDGARGGAGQRLGRAPGALIARRRATRGRAHASSLRRGFPVGDRGAQPAGLGPVKADLSRRRAAPRLPARRSARSSSAWASTPRHVIFGHTHRSGPLARRRRGRVAGAGGARLVNTGCWVYEPHVPRPPTGAARTGRAPRSSSTSGGAPQLRAPARGLDADALRPPAAPRPA